MNVPANPPMERSDVTVRGEMTSVISGAFAFSVVSYYNHVSERRHSTIRQSLDTYHDEVGKVFSVSYHHLLSGQGNV